MSRSVRKVVLLGCTLLVVLGVVTVYWPGSNGLTGGGCKQGGPVQLSRKTAAIGTEGKLFEYDRLSPIIFIGGVPRSGTTLMRAMLDAHPDVRCGEETRVVPRILQMRSHWMKSQKELMRLEEAGLSENVLDSALSAFILEVVARHGEPSNRLCNKDPFTLKSGVYLRHLFPNSKFLFMVRDGRATVHSIITRKVTITGFDLKSYRQSLSKWNGAIAAMKEQCDEINKLRPGHCLKVNYEQLILHPRSTLSTILKFLDLEWTEDVLHHEKLINKPHGISLSKVERSSDQVIKPVNLEALSKWVGKIPDDVVQDMDQIAPMLKVFGYDPHANPPNYGQPDAEVVKNTNDIEENNELWHQQEELIQKLSKKDTSK